MTSPAARLRIAVALLRQAGGADAVADGIDRYLEDAHTGLTLDLALGLSPAPGQTPWYEVEARQRRNAALRELRQRHFGDLGITAAARMIVREGRQLQASTWRRAAPPVATGDKRRLLAEALATGLPFPGERQLRTILGNEM